MSEFEDAAYIKSLEEELKKRDAEIERLKREKGISGPREGLTFSSHTGIWSDASGKLHFCPTCLNQDKRNPLKIERDGWRCTSAAHYFGNPDKRRGIIDRLEKG
jgi:hypothetical protein